MLIRVLEIPPPDGRFCFGGGKPMTFTEVDWFRDDHPQMRPDPQSEPLMATPEGQRFVAEHIRQKVYFKPDRAYLVLAQAGTFTIGYSAP